MLVAINTYPDPRHRLAGCLSDLEAFRNYLQANFDDDRTRLVLNCLTETDATRKGLIEGFTHFDQAEDGDTCIFFFAGHGSRAPAPEAFWHLEPDRMHETLVCYDSRLPGGRDLFDKELSYLIWRATKGKNIHFLAITDCCHSGSNTRVKGVVHRRIRSTRENCPPSHYLGFEAYQKDEQGQLHPPRGRHVHLAAASSNQTAKEVGVNDEQRGVFSYALLEALHTSNSQITYADLIHRTHFRIQNAVRDQRPQLGLVADQDRFLHFLTGEMSAEQKHYLVGYDKTLGWVVNAGALHGIPQDLSCLSKLQLLEGPKSVLTITQVQANQSTVDGVNGLDKRKSYRAKLVERAIPKFKLAFATDNDPAAQKGFEKLINNSEQDLAEWVSSPTQAQYLIHAKNEAFFLTRPYDLRPLFRPITGFNPTDRYAFFHALNQVLSWEQVLELDNPGSSIGANELSISLFRVTEPGCLSNDVPVEEVNWRKPISLPYAFASGKWQQPAIQLKITNTGNRNLWVCALFLAGNFGISDQLLPVHELAPGQEVWARDLFNEHEYLTIPVGIEDVYQSWGIETVQEYLKILACTAPLQTDHLVQKGMELEARPGTERFYGRRKKPAPPDWASFTLQFDIFRPLMPSTLVAGQPVVLTGAPDWTLKAPPGLKGMAMLRSFLQVMDTRDSFSSLEFPDGSFFQPAELGPPENQPGLFVLELFLEEGCEAAVSEEHPLEVIRTGQSSLTKDLILVEYRSKQQLLQALPQRRQGNAWEIYRLPKYSPTGISGLEKSIKFFFHEVL